MDVDLRPIDELEMALTKGLANGASEVDALAKQLRKEAQDAERRHKKQGGISKLSEVVSVEFPLAKAKPPQRDPHVEEVAKVPGQWVKDGDAPKCMICDAAFGLFKRRVSAYMEGAVAQCMVPADEQHAFSPSCSPTVCA